MSQYGSLTIWRKHSILNNREITGHILIQLNRELAVRNAKTGPRDENRVVDLYNAGMRFSDIKVRLEEEGSAISLK